MKPKTLELLETVKANHDWDEGQTRGGSGTRLSRTDICRVCLLERTWFDDRQNNVSNRYTFTLNDTQLSLRLAAELHCCQA